MDIVTFYATVKPCPFCGMKRGLSALEVAEGQYAIFCDIAEGGCGASGAAASTVADAVDEWNRRDMQDEITVTHICKNRKKVTEVIEYRPGNNQIYKCKWCGKISEYVNAKVIRIEIEV